MKPRLRCVSHYGANSIGATHDTGFEGDFMFFDLSGKRAPVIGIDNDKGCVNKHHFPLGTPYSVVVDHFVRAVRRWV